MAISASSVFEVQTAGSDTNGGGFVTGAAGTDYSQQNSKNTVGADISTTDAVGAGTTTLTSATANFGATIVGNIIYLQGGTGSLAAGWYQVTARASTTSITLDRAVAVGTGITMNIGGALASPAVALSLMAVGGQIAWVRSGTYTITSSTQNISGGCLKMNAAGAPLSLVGYGSTRGDLGQPTIILGAGVTTATILAVVCYAYIANFILDGNNQTTSTGILSNAANNGGNTLNVKVQNTTLNAFNAGSVVMNWIRCSATGNSGTIFSGTGNAFYCEAYANTATGFSGFTSAAYCLSYNNTGATTDGFDPIVGICENCIAYGNGRHGFKFSNDGALINCHSENNSAFGYVFTRSENTTIACTSYNNASGATSGVGASYLGASVTALSSTAFNNAAGGDFSLNSVVGGGASLRAAGMPGIYPAGTTTGYLDIGAVQHKDPMLFIQNLEGT